MGPIPGLEVAPESLQVHWWEVSSDAFPQPPLPLCCAGAARPAELVPEMFPSNPPEEEEGTLTRGLRPFQLLYFGKRKTLFHQRGL